MKKKDIELENKFLKLQLDTIHELMKNTCEYDERKLFETLGVVHHLSDKEAYSEKIDFIRENDLQYDFFN